MLGISGNTVNAERTIIKSMTGKLVYFTVPGHLLFKGIDIAVLHTEQAVDLALGPSHGIFGPISLAR